MAKVRVVVVEDSLTIRERLAEILGADPELEVVGAAPDGKRGIELCGQLRPDVITLDMILPVMSGVAATEHIMAYFPTPILIVSASFNRGELFTTYDALSAGAVDVMEKPKGDESDGEWEQRFCASVKMVSRIKVITHPRARLGAMGRSSALAAPNQLHPSAPAAPNELGAPRVRERRIVALGASTGGPSALVEVLRELPVNPTVAVIVLLHIDEPFGSVFAEWLDQQTPHRVAYPRDGDAISSFGGRVAMAPPGRHLVTRGRKFHLTSDPPRHSCRPSIDVLFETLAACHGASVGAALLTGMGGDGAAGLLAIRRAGGFTVAQDESTSVVYGMPREAALLGAATRILPLHLIGRALAAPSGSNEGRW